VVRNGEVAEIVEAAKNGEAALIAGAMCDAEKAKDISHRPACLTCARAMAGRREIINKKGRFDKT
jgi:hypothetical protein